MKIILSKSQWMKIGKDNDWLEQKSFSISDIMKFISKICNNSQLEDLMDHSKYSEKLTSISLGKFQDVNVCLINGNLVKEKMYADFVEGGNDAVYGPNGSKGKFMPQNTVWIDSNIDRQCIPYICLHELTERFLMVRNNLDYNEAHKKSNEIEIKLRKDKFFENGVK